MSYKDSRGLDSERSEGGPTSGGGYPFPNDVYHGGTGLPVDPEYGPHLTDAIEGVATVNQTTTGSERLGDQSYRSE